MKMGITACFFCCTLAANSSVSGDVYTSNLAETNTVNFNITTFAHASSFLTDNAEYVLDWVTLDIHSNINSGFAQVKIRSDNGGSPGAELEDLGTFNMTAGDTLQALTSSGISLLPNTRYWITAGETGDGSASWKGTTSTAEVSPGNWTIGDDDFQSSDGGASWQPTSFGPPNESSLFSVNATPVILPPYVSNLAEANTVNFNITSFAHASSFLTDNSGYVLDQVTLDIHSNSGSGFAQVKIRSDSGGAPGAVLEDLGTFSMTAGDTLQTLTSTGISLSPNTRYWVTAGESGSGSASWKGTSSTAEVSAGTWTIGDDDYQSTDGGASWQPTFFGPANESSLFSVDATPASLDGDLDLDGFVGIADLNIVLGAWNQNVPPGNPAADPSGDGFVGIQDLNIVLGNWNAGTPPGEQNNRVPEPSALLLLTAGTAACLRRHVV